jgi:hypothetical protein
VNIKAGVDNFTVQTSLSTDIHSGYVLLECPEGYSGIDSVVIFSDMGIEYSHPDHVAPANFFDWNEPDKEDRFIKLMASSNSDVVGKLILTDEGEEGTTYLGTKFAGEVIGLVRSYMVSILYWRRGVRIDTI